MLPCRYHFDGLIPFTEELYGFLSVVVVVFCQVEVCARG